MTLQYHNCVTSFYDQLFMIDNIPFLAKISKNSALYDVLQNSSKKSNQYTNITNKILLTLVTQFI